MSSLPLCATRLSIKLGFNCLNAKCKFYNVETRMKNMFGKWVRFEKLRNIFESKISLIRRGALDRFLIRYRPISFFHFIQLSVEITSRADRNKFIEFHEFITRFRTILPCRLRLVTKSLMNREETLPNGNNPYSPIFRSMICTSRLVL